MPSCQVHACKAAPHQNSGSHTFPTPRLPYHHRITFPLTFTPFKPGLNYNAVRALSFATFHMLISLFVVELCFLQKHLPPPPPPRPCHPSPFIFFFSSSGIATLDLGGNPPVQCSYFDLWHISRSRAIHSHHDALTLLQGS